MELGAFGLKPQNSNTWLRRRLWSMETYCYGATASVICISDASLTFVDLLPLAENIEKWQIVCCFKCLQPWFGLWKWQRDFFDKGCKKTVLSLQWLPVSISTGFLHRMTILILSFHWCISAGWLKYILARQILHFSPQNAQQCLTKCIIISNNNNNISFICMTIIM